MDERTVVAYHDLDLVYPSLAPFHPNLSSKNWSSQDEAAIDNSMHRAVSSVFYLAGLDIENHGKDSWNPLRDLINPGETVLIKPNLIKEFHPRYKDGWKMLMTHGSLVRAISDFVWKAVGTDGKIILADAPQTDSSFDVIAKLLGLDKIRDFYVSKGLEFSLVDLRQEKWQNRNGVITSRTLLPGDPEGSVKFNIGSKSEFLGHLGAGNYYGADYDSNVVNQRHKDDLTHEYLIAGSSIKADVIFSLPKLKTHKKAGITASLKNLVGVTADKNWLPHHTEGDIKHGGDEHPYPSTSHRMERMIVRKTRDFLEATPIFGTLLHRIMRNVGLSILGDSEEVVRSGNWWGNDTIWRMCLDLNKIISYGNSDGTFRPDVTTSRKRHFVFVDGLLAGEGSGPMNPDEIHFGTLLFGVNAPSVDAACAYLMGYDPDLIPIIRQAFLCNSYSLVEWPWEEIKLASNKIEWDNSINNIPNSSTYNFKPHFGWKGKIERY